MEILLVNWFVVGTGEQALSCHWLKQGMLLPPYLVFGPSPVLEPQIGITLGKLIQRVQRLTYPSFKEGEVNAL